MLWGTYDPEDSDSLFVHPCPLGYCRCTYTTIASTASTRDYDCYHIYDYTDEDGQCQCGRAGKITRPHYTSTDTMHVHCTVSCNQGVMTLLQACHNLVTTFLNCMALMQKFRINQNYVFHRYIMW